MHFSCLEGFVFEGTYIAMEVHPAYGDAHYRRERAVAVFPRRRPSLLALFASCHLPQLTLRDVDMRLQAVHELMLYVDKKLVSEFRGSFHHPLLTSKAGLGRTQSSDLSLGVPHTRFLFSWPVTRNFVTHIFPYPTSKAMVCSAGNRNVVYNWGGRVVLLVRETTLSSRGGARCRREKNC